MWSILAVASTSAFSASAGMLSGPAALPLLICLMAMLISSIVGGPALIGRSVGAASILVSISSWRPASDDLMLYQLLSWFSRPIWSFLGTSRRLTAAYCRIDL
ncbi:unnamed protein product [Schistosoma curassoni]|uniref:Secreted protein n=1 Tax=Schistosoma curassoni TaxID=6186 RepID=A0A183KAT4_9TREM|nr:unnamed protein product [Schistosoma curassoni]